MPPMTIQELAELVGARLEWAVLDHASGYLTLQFDSGKSLVIHADHVVVEECKPPAAPSSSSPPPSS